MIVKFEELKFKATRNVIVNGKKIRQQKTFTETINPFNTNIDGSVKTAKQVQESLIKKAAEWQNQSN